MKSTFRPHATASSLTVWQAMKEAAVPVIAYHACALFAFLAFSAVILLAEAGDVGGAIVILLGLGMTTLAGIVGGQVLAFLRVRTWIVVLFGVGCWIASIAVAAAGAASGLGDVGILFALALWLLPIALTGGLWSLETHRALWSAWVPLVYSVSAVIIWTEHRGSVANWFAGEKWAIWDLVSVGILGITVALLLVYLVTRETHRLALWRRGPTAPLAPSLTETGSARPRITFFGMVLLMGLAGVLTIATAAVAPYLWRTGPADREGEGEGYEQPQEQEAPAEPTEEPSENGFMKRMGEALQKMGEQVVEAGQKSAGSICTILTLLLLGLIGILLGWRPLKRLFVIRHLKEPFWNVPPTARIEQGWRLVEIAMGDAGVFPTAGEDAAGLARRAGPVLARLSPVEVHGLEDAAEVADRVRFGLGVGPEDLEVMQRFSGWAIDTVWERLGDREQIRCLYREL
ncbi:MAG: hypothetical protein Q8P41_24975 [Pseudomonadota bacterium]|nr:hypothetical protein [Pseudomonadota bacterium]